MIYMYILGAYKSLSPHNEKKRVSKSLRNTMRPLVHTPSSSVEGCCGLRL